MRMASDVELVSNFLCAWERRQISNRSAQWRDSIPPPPSALPQPSPRDTCSMAGGGAPIPAAVQPSARPPHHQVKSTNPPRHAPMSPPASAPGTTPLCFATSNADKLREAREILGIPVEGVALELQEIQTTDLWELIGHKADQAWARLERPVMVEDTSLIFKAWGALPGVFIKHFLEQMGTGPLVAALAPSGDVAAVAVCGVGFHDGECVHFFEGRSEGSIVAPRGPEGFGWDVIFQPLGQPLGEERTFSEMEPARKHELSMRAQALRKLEEFLRKS